MQTTINQRIKAVIELEKLSDSQFAKRIGIPQRTISNIFKRNSDIKCSVLNKILESFPRISPDWLLRGKGEMYLLDYEAKNIDNYDLDKGNIILYHYTTIDKFIGILADEILNFGRLQNSNDYRERQASIYYKTLCFCIGNRMQGFDKPRMWAQYGNFDRGVCIGFRLKELLEYNNYNENAEFEYFLVTYKSGQFLKNTEIKGKDILKYKHNDWSQENEFRFVSEKMNGLRFNKNCIESVYMGLDANEYDFIQRIGINVKLKGLHSMRGIPVKDMFKYSEKEATEDVYIGGNKIQVITYSKNSDVSDDIAKFTLQLLKSNIKKATTYSQDNLLNKCISLSEELGKLKYELDALKKDKGTAHWEERATAAAESMEKKEA